MMSIWMMAAPYAGKRPCEVGIKFSLLTMLNISAGRRGGLRSHQGVGGRTVAQLRNEARQRGIKGRSMMNKVQLEGALKP